MKILIVDDHPVLREGFAALLRGAGPQTEVIQSSTVAEALPIVEERSDIDIVVMDLRMPGVDGLAAITEVSSRRQDLPIIVLSSSEDPLDVRKALALGALGYVPKSASPTSLLSAIRLVMDGDVYVPPLMLVEQNVGPDHPRVAYPGSSLTSRQIDVLRLIAAGQPNKVIAASLDLSEKTVKSHITAIFKALNVINRTQAASAGRQYKLL